MQEIHTPLTFPRADQGRSYEAYLRRKLIDGDWRDILRHHIDIQLGPKRSTLIGLPDTGENLFASVIDQTSTMYDQAPELQHTDAFSLAALNNSFDRGEWWSNARQHQKYVKAFGESLVYVGWDIEMGHATFEFATPDVITAEPAASNSGRAATIWWARHHSIHPGAERHGWFWHRWSVAGGVGSYSIWTADRMSDVSGRFFDPAGWRGGSYPYRDEQGRPVLPFALYHAHGSGGHLFAPNRNGDIMFGALQLGLLWSAAVHGVTQASWDQRWIANGHVRGGDIQNAGGGAVQSISADPSVILQFEGQSVAAGAWGASVDIEKAERFARMYGHRLSVNYGLSPSDLVVESLNPASGASIVVSREGKRRIALRDAPHFHRGDMRLIEVVAAVNRAYGLPCFAAGARIRYRGIELTPMERQQAAQHLEIELRLGLIDDVGAYTTLHPGTSIADAESDMALIRARRAQQQLIAELRQAA